MDAFSKLPELAALIGSAPWVQCAEYADAARSPASGSTMWMLRSMPSASLPTAAANVSR
jgi:hypothetical protein